MPMVKSNMRISPGHHKDISSCTVASFLAVSKGMAFTEAPKMSQNAEEEKYISLQCYRRAQTIAFSS
jgi:hypothetical protein